jgi:hypothetical protein
MGQEIFLNKPRRTVDAIVLDNLHTRQNERMGHALQRLVFMELHGDRINLIKKWQGGEIIKMMRREH